MTVDYRSDEALIARLRERLAEQTADNERLRAELTQVKTDNESGAMAYEDLTKALAERNSEVERLRAENAVLRKTLVERTKVNGELAGELDWFLRRERHVLELAGGRKFGAQLCAGFLADYERENPKPGAGT